MGVEILLFCHDFAPHHPLLATINEHWTSNATDRGQMEWMKHIGAPLLMHGVMIIDPFRKRLVFQPYDLSFMF